MYWHKDFYSHLSDREHKKYQTITTMGKVVIEVANFSKRSPWQAGRLKLKKTTYCSRREAFHLEFYFNNLREK